MGVNSTFTFLSEDNEVVKKQLAKLQSKLQFNDTARFGGTIKVNSAEDLKTTKSFIDKFEREFSTIPKFNFKHYMEFNSPILYPRYLTYLKKLQEYSFVSGYQFSFYHRTSKSFAITISLYYDRKTVFRSNDEWLEKNPCKGFIAISLMHCTYNTYERIDEIMPFLEEIFSSLQLSLKLEEFTENGKTYQKILSVENNELRFREEKIRGASVSLIFYLKNKTPIDYFDKLMSYKFLDVTYVEGSFFGEVYPVLDRLFAEKQLSEVNGTFDRGLPWPQSILIDTYNHARVDYPREKLVEFLLQVPTNIGHFWTEFGVTIPEKLHGIFFDTPSGELTVGLDAGHLRLSFGIIGYEDLGPFFMKEFGISFKDSFVG